MKLTACRLLSAALFGLGLAGFQPAGAATTGLARQAMPAMDHSQMGTLHDGMQAMDSATPPTTSRTPIPLPSDADRQAAFPDVDGHGVHDRAINSFWLLNQLEYQDAERGSALAWELNGWIGGDIDRLWLRSEGERTNVVTENAELEALWGHAVGPWWDLVTGVRQDFKPGSPQTWAALGLQGMALYNFESQATAYLGEGGQAALRLKGDYDILLSNRLILQPTAEVNLYSRNDPQRGMGSGLADSEVGLRLRYELHRQFAPYIGVTWNRSYGKSADYAREEGDKRGETRLVLGVRLWF
ncbi:copper resistance protein B [Pseudomonas sp. MPFS]|uniref:copper resistance protein B n=1 Tax=Pseudomonas sp. MPFS TaxID=2795724 RepID=UPI001F147752|nr:copper resistance protein B [Pseudomonas sp. MPFS]UMZ09260.1 copper resistance protein B [Pseudomonas sp. MPFS]